MSSRESNSSNDVASFLADDVVSLEEFQREFGAFQVADAGSVTKRLEARYDKATSLDDLFDALEGSSSQDLVGRKFSFVDVAWQRYDSDRGAIPQAVCEVVDLSTGEATEFVTTGGMLVRFLANAKRLDAFPFDARIVEKTTKRGNKALNFERV